MKKFLSVTWVAVLSFVCGIAVSSLSHRRPPAGPEQHAIPTTQAPITQVTIGSNAPLAIGVIKKATAHVFNVEVINVSDRNIQGFTFTDYTQCASAAIPAGGGVGFLTDTLLKPGEKMVFDIGDDAPLQEGHIQKCLDTANEIRLQNKNCHFRGWHHVGRSDTWRFPRHLELVTEVTPNT